MDNNNQTPQEQFQPVNQQQFQQPMQPTSQPPKKKKKKAWLIVLIVLAVIIVIGAALGGGNDDKKTVTPAESNENIDTTAPSTAPAEQKITAGNTVTTDSIKITYKSCNTDYKDYNQYSAPANGNKIIRVEFEFENTSSNDETIGTLDCYADGTACDEYIFADDYKSSFASISSGRKSTAIEYFEVPENAEEIEIEFEDNYWTESKIIFVVK